MAKKITTIFCVVIACIFLFFVVCLLVLFLAPGVEIFGVRYSASGTSEYSKKVNIQSFAGDIYIETHDVPITIEYTPYFSTNASFSQDFVGLTKTKEKMPSFDAVLDENENLIITTHEIVKWLYSRHDFTYGLNLQLDVRYRNKNVHIKSTKSPVKIDGAVECETFELETTGAFKFDSIKATNFTYKTNKAITINDKIDCINADLSTSSGNIVVEHALQGNLVCKVKNNDVKFVACKNLTITSTGGDIGCAVEGQNAITGNATITTNSGNITLGNMLTDNSTLKINTISGDVSINSVSNADITAERGKVKIESGKSLVINTRTASTQVNSVTGSIIVNSGFGGVVLGKNGGEVNNPQISTTSGAIEVHGAKGKVQLESTKSKITFENGSSTDITINAGRALSATKLQGKVKLSANGDVSLAFAASPSTFELDAKKKAKKINIDLKCTSFSEVNFDILSTKGKKAKVYAGDALAINESSIKQENNPYFLTIYIRSVNSSLNLYLS